MGGVRETIGENVRAPLATSASVLDQISDAVVVVDHDQRILYWNPAAEALYGVPAREALGRPLSDAYECRWPSPDDEQAARESLERHGRWRGASVHVLRTGQERTVESTVTVLRDERGASIGLLAVIRDHTERVAAEHARDSARRDLWITSRRLEAAQRAGRVGIFDWDLPADRVYWSPDLYQLMGHEPGALEPTSEAWLQALPDDDRQRSLEAMNAAFAVKREDIELEVRLRQPDGRERWVRTTALVSYDGEGRPVRLQGAAVDIDDLKQACAARDALLAMVSHELRTPLHCILGWTRMLRETRAEGAKLARGLDVIESSAMTQERLVTDLLDLSRIARGNLRLNLETTDLGAVVAAAVDVVRPAAEDKRIRLVVEVDPATSLVADERRLQQVVWNLVQNAVRFTPAGGCVTVRAERTASGISLSVADTGAGIDPEHLGHVFEPFTQIDGATTRAHGGLGLGLAIVRQVVEAHGGRVEASSPGLGAGTTFTVHLPV